jgi:VanZ family protein
MQQPPAPPKRRLSWAVASWLLWGAALAAWTYGLLSPSPPLVGAALLTPDASFYASKSLHVLAYAALALAACWLPARAGARALAWLGLLGHAALTEFLQQYVEGRSGSVRDVGLDSLGILLGAALGLAWRGLTGRR